MKNDHSWSYNYLSSLRNGASRWMRLGSGGMRSPWLSPSLKITIHNFWNFSRLEPGADNVITTIVHLSFQTHSHFWKKRCNLLYADDLAIILKGKCLLTLELQMNTLLISLESWLTDRYIEVSVTKQKLWYFVKNMIRAPRI